MVTTRRKAYGSTNSSSKCFMLTLPTEILLIVIKSLYSLREVSRLSQTCRLLANVCNANDTAIADHIDSVTTVELDDSDLRYILVTKIADLDERLYMMRKERVSKPETRQLPVISYISEDALRLAKAQLEFISPSTKHYHHRGIYEAEANHLRETRLTECSITKPSSESPNVFGIRFQASSNTRDAARALNLWAHVHFPRNRYAGTGCAVHLKGHLLKHERSRLLSTWYFLKLWTLSYHFETGGLRNELRERAVKLSKSQYSILQKLINSLLMRTSFDSRKRLGIFIDSPHNAAGPYIARDWRSVNECIDGSFCGCCAEETSIHLFDKAIQICDTCEGKGTCKPRPIDADIWETSRIKGEFADDDKNQS